MVVRLTLLSGLCLSGPALVKAVTYTHFVAPNGSPASLCTQREPCSLTRAVALIGSADMPPGSTVLVQYGADGIYSQASLVFAGSGAAGNPIKFVGENGVRLTGTRFKPDPSAWRLVPGRKYTYHLDWDESVNFTSVSPAQRPPVANWRPILVEDRRPPFTTPSTRRFTLEFPPRYANRTSVDQVEAQHCTHWNDTANNKIYVHTCDDGRPSHINNLYLSSGNWGSVIINGDHLWLENIGIEQASSNAGGGLRVNTSADRTVLRKIAARAADVTLFGTNTIAEDLDIGHVIVQGIDPTECYDANPAFGVGECWNAAGQGAALLIGVEGTSASFGQVVRRARVHRSWNGGGVRGPNTLEHSSFWGLANHALGARGTGGVIRHNTFVNAQDSIYLERNDFDDLTVEHNLFANGALFWVSNNGVGGTPPHAWRFRYNIATSVVYDDKTYPAVTANCNLYIPSAGNTMLMRVTGTDGRKGIGYSTLAEIQANTSLEAQSAALPHTKWTDGTQFRRFEGEMSPDFDVRPASGAASLDICGTKIGPNPIPTPSDIRINR
jgi:hypothetical protein